MEIFITKECVTDWNTFIAPYSEVIFLEEGGQCRVLIPSVGISLLVNFNVFRFDSPSVTTVNTMEDFFGNLENVFHAKSTEAMLLASINLQNAEIINLLTQIRDNQTPPK